MFFFQQPPSKEKLLDKFFRYGVSQNLKFVLERIENIVRKGENVGYQHFLLFLQGFQKLSFFFLVIKKRDCVAKG